MPLQLPSMDPCYFCECVLAGSRGWNFIARGEHVLTLLNGRQYEMGQCIRAAHEDYARVTDTKRATVTELKAHLVEPG